MKDWPSTCRTVVEPRRSARRKPGKRSSPESISTPSGWKDLRRQVRPFRPHVLPPVRNVRRSPHRATPDPSLQSWPNSPEASTSRTHSHGPQENRSRPRGIASSPPSPPRNSTCSSEGPSPQQPVSVQPSGCQSVATSHCARRSTGFSLPQALPTPTPRAHQLQPAKLPPRRTLGLLDPGPQTLAKHRYMTRKSSYSYSRPRIPKSRTAPSNVPNQHPRQLFGHRPIHRSRSRACPPRALPSGHAAHVRGPTSSLEIRSDR